MARLSSHEGGGAWPGGVGGLPPGPLGRGRTLFGDGTYSGNVIQGGSALQPVDGIVTVTAAATVAPDAVTGASVVMCGWLIVDGASAAVTPSTNSKGLFIFARYGIIVRNGGKINHNNLGKAGNFGNVAVWDLIPESLKIKLKQSGFDAYVVAGEGAAGGATGSPPSAAGAGAAMQTGGGGAGGGWNGGAVSASGGKGGPFCGGAGGACNTTDALGKAGPYGGPGGNSIANAARGPGDPGGSSGGGDGGTLPIPPGAGGGLLMVFTPSLSVASGCVVSSDGATGGAGTAYGSGGCGGGIVVITTLAGGYSNAGTVRANGGGITTASYNGFVGGAGSVNTFTVS